MPAAAILNRGSLDAYRYREMVQSGQGLRLHRRGAALNMIVKQLLNVSVECAPVVFGKPFKLRLQRGFDS